ncbi:MAG: response regulator transcription factor [Propionibacteriaceae bacterium]
MEMPWTVLIVDDDDMAREAYSAFCHRQKDLEVVGEATNGQESIERYRELQPDIVLMDLQMPRLSGIEATRLICSEFPDACIIALTTFATPKHVIPALKAGAAGYLLKDCGSTALRSGIKDAKAGQMPLSPAVRLALVNDVCTQEGCCGNDDIPVELTLREKELVVWLARGLSNKDIADEMAISEGSVKQYLTNIADKLGVRARTQILVKALQKGIIDVNTL